MPLIPQHYTSFSPLVERDRCIVSASDMLEILNHLYLHSWVTRYVSFNRQYASYLVQIMLYIVLWLLWTACGPVFHMYYLPYASNSVHRFIDMERYHKVSRQQTLLNYQNIPEQTVKGNVGSWLRLAVLTVLLLHMNLLLHSVSLSCPAAAVTPVRPFAPLWLLTMWCLSKQSHLGLNKDFNPQIFVATQ